jgi:DNA-directed RNA polymerase subunit RPC12/RpoP
MPIQVECTGCGKRYSVDEKYAGKKARCKNCGGQMVVPHPPPAAAESGGTDVDYDAMAAMGFGAAEDTGPIAVAPPPVPAAAPPAATRYGAVPLPASVPSASPAGRIAGPRFGFHLNRAIIALLIGGVVLFVYGAREWQLSSSASSTPQDITCVQLEKNGPGNNAYVHLTGFIPLKNFVFQKRSRSDAEFSMVFIPVAAENGAYVTGIKVKALFGQIKSDDDVAPPSDIKVIVKSNQVKNLQDEASFAHRRDVRGMVINKIASLSQKERDLLQSAYPGTDFNKCWIVEEGREPMAAGTYMAALGGGLALVMLGLFLMFKPQ